MTSYTGLTVLPSSTENRLAAAAFRPYHDKIIDLVHCLQQLAQPVVQEQKSLPAQVPITLHTHCKQHLQRLANLTTELQAEVKTDQLDLFIALVEDQSLKFLLPALQGAVVESDEAYLAYLFTAIIELDQNLQRHEYPLLTVVMAQLYQQTPLYPNRIELLQFTVQRLLSVSNPDGSPDHSLVEQFNSDLDQAIRQQQHRNQNTTVSVFRTLWQLREFDYAAWLWNELEQPKRQYLAQANKFELLHQALIAGDQVVVDQAWQDLDRKKQAKMLRSLDSITLNAIIANGQGQMLASLFTKAKQLDQQIETSLQQPGIFNLLWRFWRRLSGTHSQALQQKTTEQVLVACLNNDRVTVAFLWQQQEEKALKQLLFKIAQPMPLGFLIKEPLLNSDFWQALMQQPQTLCWLLNKNGVLYANDASKRKQLQHALAKHLCSHHLLSAGTSAHLAEKMTAILDNNRLQFNHLELLCRLKVLAVPLSQEIVAQIPLLDPTQVQVIIQVLASYTPDILTAAGVQQMFEVARQNLLFPPLLPAEQAVGPVFQPNSDATYSTTWMWDAVKNKPARSLPTASPAMPEPPEQTPAKLLKK